jgi:hypothetical protein
MFTHERLNGLKYTYNSAYFCLVGLWAFLNFYRFEFSNFSLQENIR